MYHKMEFTTIIKTAVNTSKNAVQLVAYGYDNTKSDGIVLGMCLAVTSIHQVE